MLPLETKQSGGKLLPQSDLRGGVFLDEASRHLLTYLLHGAESFLRS
jgi:hypothetical protein